MSISIDPTFSLKMIATSLAQEVPSSSTLENNQKTEEKINILDSAMSNFPGLYDKLITIQWRLQKVREEKDINSLSLGVTLVSELSQDVNNVITTIEMVCDRTRLMVEKIEENSTAQKSIATKKMTGHLNRRFDLNTKKDALLAIEELERGKRRLKDDFLSETNSNQPFFMQLPELQRVFTDLSSDPSSKSEQE